MRQADVVVGGTYLARVSGVLVRVRVESVSTGTDFHRVTRYVVKNLATGNRVRRTAAALRQSTREDREANERLLASRQAGAASPKEIARAFGVTTPPILCGECKKTKEEHDVDGECRTE